MTKNFKLYVAVVTVKENFKQFLLYIILSELFILVTLFLAIMLFSAGRLV